MWKSLVHIRESNVYLITREQLYNVIAVYIITVLIRSSAKFESHYSLLAVSSYFDHFFLADRQTDRYFIDRKKVNPDLFVIEIEICTCIYNIVNLLKSYDNIHSMTYITKIMLTGIAIRNTGYILKIRLKGIARVT